MAVAPKCLLSFKYLLFNSSNKMRSRKNKAERSDTMSLWNPRNKISETVTSVGVRFSLRVGEIPLLQIIMAVTIIWHCLLCLIYVTYARTVVCTEGSYEIRIRCFMYQFPWNFVEAHLFWQKKHLPNMFHSGLAKTWQVGFQVGVLWWVSLLNLFFFIFTGTPWCWLIQYFAID